MGHRQARPHHELSDKVAVANAPHAVLRDALEAELALQELAVERERVARERAAAQWQDRYARDELLQALEVVPEGERMGEEEVRPANGLSALLEIRIRN